MSRTTDYIGTDRRFIYDRGNILNQQAQDRSNDYDERAGFYGSAADEHYIPLAEGRGGYSQNEQEDIMGRGRLNAMYLQPGEEQEAYLNDGEQQLIRGNPWNRARWFDPVQDMAGVYRGNDTGVRNVERMQSDLDSAAPGLRASSEFMSQTDPNRVRMSQDFVDRYRMSPEQRDAMMRSVARDSTAVSQSDMARNLEAARAAGMDPLGVASYTQRANRQSRQDTNRALADARVRASEAQANRELNIENTRIGAERTAGDVAQAREGMRLGAEQDLAGRRYNIGAARLGQGEAAAGREQQQRQFNTSTGTKIAGDMEDQQTGTERFLATNRQGAAQQNRQDRYDRNRYVDQQLSGRTAGVADTRMGAEREGRQYLVDQQNTRINAAQRERDRQAGLYGTQGQLANQTTQAQATQDNQPKWWEKVLGAVGGVGQGLGAMATAGMI